jgi:hypothetical protein
LRNKDSVKKVTKFLRLFYVFRTKDLIREIYKKLVFIVRIPAMKGKDSQTKEIFKGHLLFSQFLAQAVVSERSIRSERLKAANRS